MIEIRIEKNFDGPTLLEMLELIEDNLVPITVRWENTKEEIHQLARLRQRSITLVVDDLAAMGRAAESTGLGLVFDQAMADKGSLALNDAAVSNWRGLIHSLGSTPGEAATASRGLLIDMANRILRGGAQGWHFRAVLNECLFEGVSSFDMDVLLGLRARR